MLKLYFFQNCISPHQMPYIEALSRREDVSHVWVIAPRMSYDDRAAMGWLVQWTTSTEKMTIEIVKDEKWSVESVLDVAGNLDDTYCLFSGITAFPEVASWFRQSLRYKVRRGIITEVPYTYDKPLWMHKIRFLLKDFRYIRYIDYVFAIGEECAKYYKGWSKKWKVVDFLYCTSQDALPKLQSLDYNHQPLIQDLCFVGSLDRRKNVKVLLEALALVKESLMNVTIVGDGEERTALEEKARSLGRNINIRFVGSKPMDEVQEIIASHDVLVLPSLHDGWGAVINEAMSLGTVPVCSNKCGAKALIRKSGQGGVFDVAHPEQLALILLEISGSLERLRKDRQKRVEWAKEHISPEAVAEYFIQEIS